MATINDVAKLAGVSRSTVSRAFNSDTSIKQTTKEKVMLAQLFHAFNSKSIHGSIFQATTWKKNSLIGRSSSRLLY
ncbi:LacI family DNA-binding transcriptional regulator [Pediococcus acidilactici]